MSKEDALVYAYLLDGKGNGKALNWSAVNEWDSTQGMLWIHLDSKLPETRSWLESKSGLSQIVQE